MDGRTGPALTHRPLQRIGRLRPMMRLDRLGLIAAVAIVALGAPVIVGARPCPRLESRLPEPTAPAEVATSTVVLDRDGRLLRPFTIADGRWRLPVTKADVDQRFLDMLIAYEDRRFAEHDGVDYRRWSAPRASSCSPAATSSPAARRSPCRSRA